MVLAPNVSYGKEWYFSWGYQREFWAPSDIHISQPDLGNDFTIENVKALDYAGWNEAGGIFNKDFSVPQWNLRFGRFLNSDHSVAVEFSIDHSKYSSTLNQTAHVKGTIGGVPVDQDSVLTPDFFNYKLHNGANHIMVNLVKRFALHGGINQTGSFSLLVKGGLGIMLPHAENTVLGRDADVGAKSSSNLVGTNSGWWRLNGWTTGYEVAVRYVPISPVYLELSDKLLYAHLSNVPVYRGKADQALLMNAFIFNLGVTFNGDTGGP